VETKADTFKFYTSLHQILQAALVGRAWKVRGLNPWSGD